MKEPIRILNSLDDIDIQFFDEDPDGEEDRAGDGHYFQISGEEGWSGAWHSEEQAHEEAIESLRDKERRNIVAEAIEDGYFCIRNDETGIDLINKVDDRWFRVFVDVENHRIRAVELSGNGGLTTIVDTNDELALPEEERMLPEKMEHEEEFGRYHVVVRAAFEAIAARAEPSLSM